MSVNDQSVAVNRMYREDLVRGENGSGQSPLGDRQWGREGEEGPALTPRRLLGAAPIITPPSCLASQSHKGRILDKVQRGQ